MRATPERWFLGVDIGGTFTDTVLANEDGRLFTTKVRTSAEDPVAALVTGTRDLLDQAGVSGVEVARVVHGTTLATNLVLEDKGAVVALATTRGFRDLGRSRGIDGGTESLVQSWMTVEVPERMTARGETLIPLTREEAARAARRLARLKPEAVAVCFLHSYVNGVHEAMLAEELRSLSPDLPIYLSSRVTPTMREYGRAMTTVVSAYVGPVMADYLGRVEKALYGLGISCPIHIMESGGGVMPLDTACEWAARTLESGPAAGVIATQLLADDLHRANLLSFDMGGTTAKCGVIVNGQIERKSELHVRGSASTTGRRGGGIPVRVPVVDLAEVGAGGGSIAWLDEAGGLRVGPQSAGAEPGPACYGSGGMSATVTDANVVLGYVNPQMVAGGSLAISPDLAAAAIADTIAGPLGATVLEAAAAIFETVTANMAAAVRMVTIERGLDPRDFTLVGFGGAGGIHLAEIARQFGIRQGVVPLFAGVRSALGLLGTDLSTEVVQSCLASLDAHHFGQVEACFERLEGWAVGDLNGGAAEHADDGASDYGETKGVRMVDVRYVGQAHELTVAVSEGPFDAAEAERLVRAFGDQYAKVFGLHRTGPVELVNCRYRLVRTAPNLGRPASAVSVEMRSATPAGHRTVWFEGLEARSTPVFDWRQLAPGAKVLGAAVIDAPDATVVIPPDATVEVDDARNLRLTLEGP